jgi:hypothetical protein
MTGIAGIGVIGASLLMLWLTPLPAPGPAIQAQRYPFDIAAKLQLMGGDGCPCLNVRFTNLGPAGSPRFTYQVVQYQWLAPQKRYATGKDLNTQSEGAVPVLGPAASWQKSYPLTLETPSSYLFKIIYTPPLNDGNLANHSVQLRYVFP